MKRYFLALSLIFVTGWTLAQPVAPAVVGGLDIEGERSRIQAERMREEARFEQEEAACYARFAVTDCLRGVRVRRSKVMVELRQQDILLNDAQRKQKAQAQLERIAEKAAAQQSEEGATNRLEALQAQKERTERAKQKAADANAKAAQGAVRREPKASEPGRSAQEMTKEQEQYTRKVQEAQERKASKEKSLREKSGSTSKPLPSAP